MIDRRTDVSFALGARPYERGGAVRPSPWRTVQAHHVVGPRRSRIRTACSLLPLCRSSAPRRTVSPRSPRRSSRRRRGVTFMCAVARLAAACSRACATPAAFSDRHHRSAWLLSSHPSPERRTANNSLAGQNRSPKKRSLAEGERSGRLTARLGPGPGRKLQSGREIDVPLRQCRLLDLVAGSATLSGRRPISNYQSSEGPKSTRYFAAWDELRLRHES
jgi:hypothetical protein